MEKDEAWAYILEQAKTEIEYTRSWPTKAMAFYVVIHLSLFAIFKEICSLPYLILAIIISCFLLSFSVLLMCVLVRVNINYLKHRNIQIKFQKENKKILSGRYDLGKKWFEKKEIPECFIDDNGFTISNCFLYICKNLSKGILKWGFYICIVIMFILLTLAFIFLLVFQIFLI